jgi:hypothetical protein
MKILLSFIISAIIFSGENAIAADGLDAKSVAVGAGAVVAAPMAIAGAGVIVSGALAVAAPAVVGASIVATNPLVLANKYLDDDCWKDSQTGIVWGCNTTTAKYPLTNIGIMNKCPDNSAPDGAKIFSSFPKVMQCSEGATADRWIEVSQSICAGFPAVNAVPKNAKATYIKSGTQDACWGWTCNDTFGLNSEYNCVKVCKFNNKEYMVGTKLNCTGNGAESAYSECGATGAFGRCIATKCKSTHKLQNGQCVANSAPVASTEPNTNILPSVSVLACKTDTKNWLIDVVRDYTNTDTKIVNLAKQLLDMCNGVNLDTDNFDSLESQLHILINQAEVNAAQQESALRIRIESLFQNIISTQSALMSDLTVWRDVDGNFNTARLVSDSVAGVVLGTAGGLITSNVIKKNQVENGFEDLSCTVGGQVVANWADQFSVGI